MSSIGILIAACFSYLQVIDDFLPDLKDSKRLSVFCGIGFVVYGFLISVSLGTIFVGVIVGSILGVRHNFIMEAKKAQSAQVPQLSVEIESSQEMEIVTSTFDDSNQDVQRTYFCPNCGNPLKSEDKFCSSCGNKIDPEIFQRKRLN